MIADTPEPPYFAAIFTSLRTEKDEGYAATAERMQELAAQQPGYLGFESVRGADGFGISVAYFRSLEEMAAWRRNLEHLAAQQHGREKFYQRYQVRVCRVERQYGFTRG